MEESRNYRTKKFQTYSKESETKELMTEGIQIQGEALDSNGFPIPLEWALWIKGLILGLKNVNDDTLDLAVIENYIEEERLLRMTTPLRDIEKVKIIQLSSLKVIPLYEGEGG